MSSKIKISTCFLRFRASRTILVPCLSVCLSVVNPCPGQNYTNLWSDFDEIFRDCAGQVLDGPLSISAPSDQQERVRMRKREFPGTSVSRFLMNRFCSNLEVSQGLTSKRHPISFNQIGQAIAAAHARTLNLLLQPKLRNYSTNFDEIFRDCVGQVLDGGPLNKILR